MSKLNPENQFIPSFERVRQLMARYNLPLSKYEAADSGIENSTLIVSSGERQFVLRVYRQGKKQYTEIELELDFMATLRQHGLPVPAIVASPNNELFVVSKFGEQRWQSVLMEYAAGGHPKKYTSALIADMALQQAKMHLIGEEYARQHYLSSNQTELKLEAVTVANGPFREFLQRANEAVVELDESLPQGMCHLDYDAENLFADENGHVTAILDFDDARCSPLVVCLGFTLWDIVTSVEEPRELIGQYLREYEQVRPLTPAEKAVLPQVMLFRHYMVIGIDIQLGDLRHGDFEDALRWEKWLGELRFV